MQISEGKRMPQLSATLLQLVVPIPPCFREVTGLDPFLDDIDRSAPKKDGSGVIWRKMLPDLLGEQVVRAQGIVWDFKHRIDVKIVSDRRVGTKIKSDRLICAWLESPPPQSCVAAGWDLFVFEHFKFEIDDLLGSAAGERLGDHLHGHLVQVVVVVKIDRFVAVSNLLFINMSGRSLPFVFL